MAKRAQVENGNKNYHKRVFAIRGARIVKSWDVNYYLKTSLSVLKAEIPIEPITSQRFVK